MIIDPQYLLPAPDPKNYKTFEEYFGVEKKEDIKKNPHDLVELMTLGIMNPRTGIMQNFKLTLERHIVIDLIEGRRGLEVLDIFDFGDPAAIIFLKQVVAAHIEKIRKLYEKKV